MALIEGIPGEFGPQPWGEAILRRRDLLLRITRRPVDREVRLPGLATTPRHVVEDRTGKALTWRRDGDDLLVTLPEAGDLPVVRVALEGKLRIVPPDTVTANADGVWDLNPHSSTAYLVGRRAAEVAVKFFGPADSTTSYRITLNNHSYVVPGATLTATTIGPYAVPAGRVVELTVEPINRSRQPSAFAPGRGRGEPSSPRSVGGSAPDGIPLGRVLVAPVGTVLASVEDAGPGRVAVTVTNFGRTAAQGEVFVASAAQGEVFVASAAQGEVFVASATPEQWSFEDLAPGAAFTTTVSLPGDALSVRLDAGRRSASLAFRRE